MSAYYNDNDPFVCAWLRELIKAGLIAPGEVDERSIEDVQADDLRGFTQCHFFAGIGVWSYALRRAGWADGVPVWTGSCPCQSFSASGKREGFSDKRHLWPSWFRLIRECRPDVCFGEQVASQDGLAWFDVVSAEMEGEGYAVGAADICAAGFGAPHIRQRLYFVADAQTDGRQYESAFSRINGAMAKSPRERVGVSGESRVEFMADAVGRRREQRNTSNGRVPKSDADITSDELGNAKRNGRERQSLRADRNAQDGTAEASCVVAVADPNKLESSNGELQRSGRLGRSAEDAALSVMAESGSEQTESAATGRLHADTGERGATNGFWRDAEWLYCRDDKYRPVEPGVAPLVTGTPNRVGRLRGYGNAINAQVAQGFIEAYLEAT